MTEKNQYNFPETNPFYAQEVTSLTFDIKEHPYADLYVNLDAARMVALESRYRIRLKRLLNLKDDVLENPPKDYVKIIFSGHWGTGKTLELRRFHEDLNHPDRYFSILIELEEEVEISHFQPEDYFILLILKLAQALEEKVNSIHAQLKKIIQEWEQEVEIVKESQKSAKGEVGLETEGGFNFLGLFKSKGSLKGFFSGETKISHVIRQSIKKNPLELIAKFNLALKEIREDIRRNHLAQDILFIVDGSEKISEETYESLFVTDNYLLLDIDVNLISSTRIDSFYKLEQARKIDMFKSVILPMIQVENNPQAIALLKKAITVRISEEKFFEDKVLDYFAEMSGGCIRQMFDIVNQTLQYSEGEKITLEFAQKVIEILSRKMHETLTYADEELLKSKKWNKPAEPAVAKLIHSLVLLKYNGHITINPLLKKYFP